MTAPDVRLDPEAIFGESVELEAVMSPTRLELALDIVRTVAHAIAAIALVIIAA